MRREFGRLAWLVLGLAVLASDPTGALTAPTPVPFETPAAARPRIVVTTDPELDDANSMIRYLLYASDYRTVGLVYASSAVHWSGDMKGTRFAHADREYSKPGAVTCPCTSYRWPTGQLHIDRAIDAYAKVYDNLKMHDANYPTPDYLRSIMRWGNTEFEGDISHDTAGSDLIRALLLDGEATPVYLLAWGGESTIARALKSIEEEFGNSSDWPAIKARVSAKAVIVPSGHQDDTYVDYIRPVWPQVRYLERADGVPVGYGAQSQVSVGDAAYYSTAWIRTHVLERGPMGALYRVWGDGQQMVPGDTYDFFGEKGQTAQELADAGFVVWTPPQETGSFISEGDTPTFFDFLGNGLEGYRSATPGGWAGHRMTRDDQERMAAMYELFMKDPGALTKLPRRPEDPFVGAAQRDFAGRLAWSTASSFGAANHNPAIKVQTPAFVSARPGQTIRLSARASDPDGDAVTIRWWRWKAADDYPGSVNISRADMPDARLTVPRDAKAGQVFQILAEATDSGSPRLSHYAKVLVTVAP